MRHFCGIPTALGQLSTRQHAAPDQDSSSLELEDAWDRRVQADAKAECSDPEGHMA